MKRVLLWGMTVLLLLAAGGCGKQTVRTETADAPTPVATETPRETPAPTPALPPVLYLVDENGVSAGERVDVTVDGDDRAFIGFYTENTAGTGLKVHWDEAAFAAQGIHAERSPTGVYLTCERMGTFDIRFYLSETDAAPDGAVEAAVTLRAGGELKDLAAYPFLDEDGYWHYRAVLDGVQLPLVHDVLVRVDDNPYNEPLFPFSELLDYYGVAYYWNRENDDFSTVINGVELSHDCGDTKYFWFTTEQWGYHVTIPPQNIDGVYFTPYFVFDYTLGATVTKVKKGQEANVAAFDITTDGTYAWGAGSTEVPIMRWDEQAHAYTADPVTDGV